MKSIVFAVLFVIAVAKAAYAPGAVSYGGPAPVSYGAPTPSVPCPKSIVVSCAPSVQAVPCAAGGARGYGLSAGGYGSSAGGYAPSVGAVHQGSYTENAPQYIVPGENAASEQWLASASSQYDNQFAGQQEYVPYTTFGGGVY